MKYVHLLSINQTSITWMVYRSSISHFHQIFKHAILQVMVLSYYWMMLLNQWLISDPVSSVHHIMISKKVLLSACCCFICCYCFSALKLVLLCPQFSLVLIPRSREVAQSWGSTVLSTLYALFKSFPVVFSCNPDLVSIICYICQRTKEGGEKWTFKFTTNSSNDYTV